MSWRVGSYFSVALAASALGLFGAEAHADEAYLCGPDKVVYVAVADLEMKKRTDPCIAAYYGLKVEDAAKATPVAAAEKVSLSKSAEIKPVPVDLKPLSDAEVPDRVTRKLQRQASLEPPRAMAGTDFRNVKILNAASPDDAWFRHTK